MALEDNALVSLSDLKVYLKLTGDASFDTVLEILINHISSTFDNIVKFNLAEQTYTSQLYNGNDKARLYLKHIPINSISAITEDDVELTEGDDEDFMIYGDRGYLWRVAGNWAKGEQNISITYKAGSVAISRMNFDSGSEEPVIGATLTSASGSGVVTAVKLTSGVWGSGTAVGQIEFASITGEFADDETVNITAGNPNVMTVNEPGGSAKDSPGVPGDIKLAAMMQLGKEWKTQDKAEWAETSRSMGDGSISLMTDDLLPYVKEVLRRYTRETL